MADNKDEVRLGSGTLFINNVNVGYLSGEVTLLVKRLGFQFAPAGSGETNLRSLETCTLRATIAQLSMDNLRLALGLSGSAATSVGSLSYNPASLSIAGSQSWQGITFGREPISGTAIPLRFEHEKKDDSDRRVCLILYNAVCRTNLVLPFGPDHVTVYDMEWLGLPDETRDAGDQVGMIIEETS